jgi:hypothetical protein
MSVIEQGLNWVHLKGFAAGLNPAVSIFAPLRAIIDNGHFQSYATTLAEHILFQTYQVSTLASPVAFADPNDGYNSANALQCLSIPTNLQLYFGLISEA